MKFSILNKLYQAIPNGSFTDSVLGASYITDRNGDIIGHIDFKNGAIFLNDKYEHLKQLIKRLDEVKLNYEIKKYIEL